MVYYNYLFRNLAELSPNEGILYSALVYKSLSVPECFSPDGKFSDEYAIAYAEDSDNFIALCDSNVTQLSKQTEMSRQTVRSCLFGLRSKYLMSSDVISCPSALISQHYLTIPPGTGLKGQQLLFYGLLLHKSQLYGGTVDSWAYKLAEQSGLTIDNVYVLIHILHRKGFIRRLDDGRLKIEGNFPASLN